MSLVVVGLSHRSAPVALLERAAVGTEQVPELVRAAMAGPHVAEALVLSTCNRVEVYADVRAFHAGVGELTARRPGLVYVSFSAYGHTGPWRERRGYDSLVQTASGIAVEQGDALGSEQPRHLPAAALSRLPAGEHPGKTFAGNDAGEGPVRQGGRSTMTGINRFKTWILIATLGGLFVGIGALLGGRQLATIMLGVAIVFNFSMHFSRASSRSCTVSSASLIPCSMTLHRASSSSTVGTSPS